MADATAQAKKQVDESTKEKQKVVAEAYGHQGKPTPTQEENDLAALGVPFDSHEDDGSGPSPQFKTVVDRQSEADKPSGGNYGTRSMTSKEQTSKEHAPQPHAPPREAAPKQQG